MTRFIQSIPKPVWIFIAILVLLLIISWFGYENWDQLETGR